jgi:hypothetical protein
MSDFLRYIGPYEILASKIIGMHYWIVSQLILQVNRLSTLKMLFPYITTNENAIHENNKMTDMILENVLSRQRA